MLFQRVEKYARSFLQIPLPHRIVHATDRESVAFLEQLQAALGLHPTHQLDVVAVRAALPTALR